MSVTIRVKMNQNVQAAMKRGQRGALLKSGMEIERAMKQTLSGPGGPTHVPSGVGSPPNRQWGELRSSCRTALRSDGNGVLSGATAKYAYTQEHGGHIKPRNSKWLTIPNRNMQIGYRRSARTLDLRFIPIRTELAALVAKRKYTRTFGTKKSPLGIKWYHANIGDVIYWLVKQVTLPPRPFIQRSLAAALPNIMRHWKGMLYK